MRTLLPSLTKKPSKARQANLSSPKHHINLSPNFPLIHKPSVATNCSFLKIIP